MLLLLLLACGPPSWMFPNEYAVIGAQESCAYQTETADTSDTGALPTEDDPPIIRAVTTQP